MEPKRSALSNPCLDGCPMQEKIHEIKSEISEQSVTYVSVKFKASDAQKKPKNRIWKVKASPWCLAPVVFAFLYLIVLIAAAIKTAQVNCLEEILIKKETNEQNVTAHCKIL